MQGKFIVVEGLEGAGKSSVIATISNFLQQRGLNCIQTREPGGTPMAEAIRDCVKHNWSEKVNEKTELLLMYAARCQLVENVIKPALEQGTWVIGDRHNLSTLAYQGGGRQIPLDYLHQLKNLTLGNFNPDFTLYLDVSPEVGLTRARGRGELDRIEQSGMAFFQRARQEYQNQLNTIENSQLINAEQEMQKVHSDVVATLARWID
ncbi:dTMP kinase [Glaciecola sp. 1036]|uniref:dTMP kinase n=1 Tax=Alteromonadaceae TaxID=72275 RepID=UPI003D06CE74